MNPKHIRNERATRDAMERSGKDPGGKMPDCAGVSWCGKEWVDCSFLGADHALMHLKYAGSLGPCVGCLAELREIIDAELGDR